MQISEKGKSLIVYYETGNHPEKYLTAYWDANGKVWTIGIGSTLNLDGSPVKQGDQITLSEAYDLLEGHLQKRVYPSLKDLTLTQDQFDAVVDFVYNVGSGNFLSSTLYKLLKAGKDASGEFPKWNKSGGKVLPGLTKRRASERELYQSGKLVF